MFALLEYAFILTRKRWFLMQKYKSELKVTEKEKQKSAWKDSKNGEVKNAYKEILIDKISLILYWCCIVLFNIIFFAVYA